MEHWARGRARRRECKTRAGPWESTAHHSNLRTSPGPSAIASCLKGDDARSGLRAPCVHLLDDPALGVSVVISSAFPVKGIARDIREYPLPAASCLTQAPLPVEDDAIPGGSREQRAELSVDRAHPADPPRIHLGVVDAKRAPHASLGPLFDIASEGPDDEYVLYAAALKDPPEVPLADEILTRSIA